MMCLGASQVYAQTIPIPFRIGGAVTIDGIQITQVTDDGLEIKVTKQNGADYTDANGNLPEDNNGLNSSGWYLIDVPMFDTYAQPGGAQTGETAVIHVFVNNVELDVTSPLNGEFQIGNEGQTQQIDITGDSDEEPTCEYSISPEEETFTSEGGAGSVDISTEDGCDWTAASNNGWIFITSGSGSGDGTIEYAVSEYTGETSRTSYFTITGDGYTATVAVTQDGTGGGGGGGGQCAYSLSSTEEYFTADSGTSSLSVTTDDGCEWTAVSNIGWITITSGNSGTGSGTVEYSVLENTGPDPRTGTMTIAGETCTVTQSESGGGGGVGNPLPDIQANSSDGPVILQKGEMLSVTVSLNPRGNAEDADWWIYATAPVFQTSWWYTLDSGWVPSDTPIRVHGGPLFSLAPYTIVERSTLPIGNYVFNFEVDNNMDNFKDGTWTDSVEVTVEEGDGGGGGLPSPTGFTASADGTTVTLSWDAVDEAEGYMLYYGYSSGEYSGTVDLGNSTGMVFENVPEGTYYVVITAYAGTEESGYSEEERVTVR